MSYCDDMFGLQGKTAAITGGGGMIAGALAEALVQGGANVALWCIRPGSAEPLVGRITELMGTDEKICNIQADAGDEVSVRRALEETEERFGKVDILVNAVGGNKGKGPFIEIDVEQFDSILRLNLLAGLVIPTKVVASRWISQKAKGSVVNLASMSSYIPLSGVWAYDASKSAVMNLTMATAKEFAPHGIRVNALAPGFFLGKQNRALLVDEQTGKPTQRGQEVITHTPFGRFGEVSELAGAMLFLASDKASGFVTGMTLPVDGGYLVHNV